MTDTIKHNTLTASIHERKSGFRQLVEGFACEWKEMTADMKKQFGLVGSAMKEWAVAPIKTAKDIKKGFKLIAQGKFRELRGKVAQRLAANLQAQGIIGNKTYENMAYKAEQKFGVGKVEASDFSKAHGALVKPAIDKLRDLFKRRGR